MPNNSEVLAVILGGGRGARLYPLTQQRSKPAVPIAGKYRLIDIPMSNCFHADIEKIAILTQYNSASLHRHIWSTYTRDQFSPGWVQILAAEQTPRSADWYQGTADAVRKQWIEIKTAGTKYVLILAGDHLYRMDYRQFVAHHIETGADITVAVQPVAREAVSGLGILKMGNDNLITAFAEKPKKPEVLKEFENALNPDKPFLASMGIYLFQASQLFDWLCADATRKDSCRDFGRDILPRLVASHRLLRTLNSFIHSRPASFDFRKGQYRDGQTVFCCGVKKVDVTKLEAWEWFCALWFPCFSVCF